MRVVIPQGLVGEGGSGNGTAFPALLLAAARRGFLIKSNHTISRCQKRLRVLAPQGEQELVPLVKVREEVFVC